MPIAMKVISLISGGIDSAVSTALALEQGHEVVSLHLSTVPFADEKSQKKTEQILSQLCEKFNVKMKLHVAPHGDSALTEIAKNCDRKYNCVLCRRMMLRIGEKVAEEEKAGALLTGESLGQVASQTLPNLGAEFSAVKIPILRPLLGMDKIEIEKLARKYDTFEASILPSMCCSLPEKPATKARIGIIENEEKKLNIEKLVEESLAGKRIIELGGEQNGA